MNKNSMQKLTSAFESYGVTAGIPGKPEAVLIRALEPLEGVNIMLRRRGISGTLRLTNGPGKLCQAMGITREHYGADLCGDELYIADGGYDLRVAVSERVNIDYAEEYRFMLWRYFAEGNRFVSAKNNRPQFLTDG